MIELLLAHVVLVSLCTGAAVALSVRAGRRLWLLSAEREQRELVFLASAFSSSANFGGASASASVPGCSPGSTGDGGPSVGGACGQLVCGPIGLGLASSALAVHKLSSRTVHAVPQARSTVIPAPGAVGVLP